MSFPLPSSELHAAANTKRVSYLLALSVWYCTMVFGNHLKANQIFPLYIFTTARFIVRFEFSVYCTSLIANLFSDSYLCRVVGDIYARILKRGIIRTLSHKKGNFPHSVIFLGHIRDFTIRLKPNSPTQSLFVDLFMIKSITYSTASLVRFG